MSLFKNQLVLNLGPIFLGVALNTWLYGLVSYQYLAYFSKDFRDPLWIKVTVCAFAIIDTFHSTSLIYLLWFYCVQNFTNPWALLVPLWPYRITMFVTVFTALLMHAFLCYRIMHLTNRFFCIVMLSFATVTLVVGIACSTVTWLWVKTALDMPRVNVIMSVWFTLEMCTDVLLSSTLVCILLKSRSGLGFPKSETIIKTLIRTAIQTGAAGTIFSILTVSFYITRKETQIFAAFGIPIARVYTNSLMDALLCRENLRGILQQMDEIGTVSIDTQAIHMRIAQPTFARHARSSFDSSVDVSVEHRHHDQDDPAIPDIRKLA